VHEKIVVLVLLLGDAVVLTGGLAYAEELVVEPFRARVS